MNVYKALKKSIMTKQYINGCQYTHIGYQRNIGVMKIVSDLFPIMITMTVSSCIVVVDDPT